jgi:heme-degrading monooxygenase HmoA
MFIAMNRFRIARGNEEEFEALWRGRESYLHEIDGFLEFALLKGPEHAEHTLYVSHSVWASQAHFTAWTKSEAFRKAHANAGRGKPLSLGPPDFEGFEAVLVEDNRAKAAR